MLRSKLYVGLLDQLAETNHNLHGNVDACNATDKADYLTAACVLGAETMKICISCPTLCPAISGHRSGTVVWVVWVGELDAGLVSGKAERPWTGPKAMSSQFRVHGSEAHRIALKTVTDKIYDFKIINGKYVLY